MTKLIELTTPKGEKVMVNFKHVSHVLPTKSDHSSLKFTHTIGNDNRGFYLVVLEDIIQIESQLKVI